MCSTRSGILYLKNLGYNVTIKRKCPENKTWWGWKNVKVARNFVFKHVILTSYGVGLHLLCITSDIYTKEKQA